MMSFAKTVGWYGMWMIIAAALLVGVYTMWTIVGHHPVLNSVSGFDFVGADGSTSLERAGQFGDSFGYINSLFSGLAMGGVILAILMQTVELRLQRRELHDTRKELSSQRDVLTRTLRIHAVSSQAQAWATILAGPSEYSIRSEGRESYPYTHLDFEHMFTEAVDELQSTPRPDHKADGAA